MTIRSAPIVLAISQSFVSYADHELRKSVFETLGPNAWGMYIILPIPFIALGIIGYLLYRRWKEPSETPPPSLN